MAVEESPAGLTSRSDVELLHSRGASRDAAFRELYRRHHQDVRGFLTRLVRNAQAAEDVLQETFLRVHLNREKHDAKLAFRPWLYSIARNLGLNALRGKSKPVESVAKTDPAAKDDSARLEAAKSESREEVRGALDDLPDEMRALLIQRHGLEMTLEELASSWELNERTIRTRLEKAAEQLTRALVARRQGGVA